MKRLIAVLISFTLILWLYSLVKCEILTRVYGSNFSTLYSENTMMGNIESFKVIEYSDNIARVYYISVKKSAGDVLTFEKENGVWTFNGKWETIWSNTGSASGVIWPYWWHFIYGGI